MILDASAVLVLLNGEPGAERVAATLPGARISAVNLAEVVSKLSDYGMPEADIREALSGLGLEVLPLTEAQAYAVGLLRGVTRSRGLSLGDRACLALAQSQGLSALTADGSWAGLGDPKVVVLR